MKRLSLLATSLFTLTWQASAAPASQVMLAQLEQDNIREVSAVSAESGYNNQPKIVERGIYYTAEVKKDATSQTDIFYYDFKTKNLTNISNTPVSEYSPTPMPDGSGLSAVVVEADGSQKLWRYPFKTNDVPNRLFEELGAVGYHAWGADDDLILFIVGEPHTLGYTGPHRGKPVEIARNIGRTLSFEGGRFWFSEYRGEEHWLASFRPESKALTQEMKLPDDVDYFAWYDEATLIYAKGNQIIRQSVKGQPKQWLDLSAYCATKVSRLNYAPKQHKLAFVCERNL